MNEVISGVKRLRLSELRLVERRANGLKVGTDAKGGWMQLPGFGRSPSWVGQLEGMCE